jgi:DNA-binding transcriptional LysR family regulator
MREVNLRSVDVNLLVVLETLLAEAHVTEAASKLNMSQPAVSRALSRLRAMLGDPLLVRGADGLVPTARAVALKPKLAYVLAGVRELVRPHAFDPLQATGTFTLAATDHQTILLLPHLLATLTREAPGLDLRIVRLGAETPAEVAEGRVDLALGIEENATSPSFHRDRLFTDRFVTLLRKGHRAARNWSLETFLGLNHALVTIVDDGRGAIDAVLEKKGLTRRIALRLPHFVAAMNVVAVTDLAVTVPESIARRFAKELGLAILETPVRRPPFVVVSIWSEVSHADPAHVFLRQKIREAARKVAPL